MRRRYAGVTTAQLRKLNLKVVVTIKQNKRIAEKAANLLQSSEKFSQDFNSVDFDGAKQNDLEY